MILRNCAGGSEGFSVNMTALIMTAVLAGIYFGSRKILKKGISPIALICVSALAGVIAYGF